MSSVAFPSRVRPPPRQAPRWILSLAVAVALHAALVLLLLFWSQRVAVLPAGAPVLVDLLPLPPDPVPEMIQPEPPPEPPPPEPQPPDVESPPPMLPLVTPEAVLPPPPPKPKPLPRPVPQKPQPPPSVPAPAARIEAPPPVAAPALRPAVDPMTAYAARLVAEIQRQQRYPALARQRQEEGTVMVRFALDRAGHLIESRVERASGHELLDREAQAMLRRAEPLPAAPQEIAGARLEFTLPLRFTLR